jgi:hypothetical protein
MHRHRLALVACLVGAVAPNIQASPALAAGPVKITKIHYGQNGTNLNTEYIVFKNTTSSAVQLKGWKVISAPSSDNQKYTFPRTKVGAGHTLTLYTGKGTNGPGKRYWGATSPVWNNDGDKAVLKNASGTAVDTCQYAGGGTTAFCCPLGRPLDWQGHLDGYPGVATKGTRVPIAASSTPYPGSRSPLPVGRNAARSGTARSSRAEAANVTAFRPKAQAAPATARSTAPSAGPTALIRRAPSHPPAHG